MHERTERAIARLLFVFCCAVPTVLTLFVVLVTWTPWYHHRQLAALEAAFSEQTGLIIKIDDFQRVSPYKWLLRHVRIYEPETELEVASVRQVEWLSDDDRIGIRIRQPKLQSTQLRQAWKLVHDRFLCRPELTKLPVEILANDMTIESDTGSLSMHDVAVWIKPRPTSVEASLRGLPAGRTRNPFRIDVTRDRSTDIRKTRWTLETGPTPLPCSAIAGYLPLLKRLGPESEFSGQLTWEFDSEGGWSVDLSGARFNQIELAEVFENLPHSVRGKADLVLDRCRIIPGKDVDMAGTIRANNGWIRTSLLRSMNAELNFAVDRDALVDPNGEVFYELLAVHFDLKNWLLKLKGVCGNQEYYEGVEPGIALFRRDRYLARSMGEPIKAIQLAHAIAPRHSELVPLSAQTSGLMELFVPPGHPTAEGTIPNPRIRRVDHWSGGEPIRQR